jgi:hypothetical protein
MNDPVLEALNRAADEVSPEDIDQIIAYLRKTRQNFELGIKPKKEGAVSTEEVLNKLNLGSNRSIPGFVRRV